MITILIDFDVKYNNSKSNYIPNSLSYSKVSISILPIISLQLLLFDSIISSYSMLSIILEYYSSHKLSSYNKIFILYILIYEDTFTQYVSLFSFKIFNKQ